jgi:small-conductance mechanosensitive channel
MCRRWFIKSFCLTWPILFMVLLVPSSGEETGVPKNTEVSTKEMSEVVNLLEDSQKREAFVKDLRNIINVKKSRTVTLRAQEKTPRKALLIENLFTRFESLSGRIVGAAASSASLIAGSPEALGEVKAFISERENQSKLLRLLGDIVGGILIALIVSFIFRRYIPRIDTRIGSLIYKVATGLLQVILVLIPYGVLLLSLFVLFKMFPSFPGGHSLALLFFMLLFFYRGALEAFRILLSPDEARARILPFKDENANYFWVWMLRFARYTFFYFLVTNTLFIVKIAPPSFYFVRGLLLVVFPVLISVFIMQVAREMRKRYHRSPKNPEGLEGGSRRISTLLLRYWSIIAIAYAWAIFLFLIINYEKGFSYLFVATLKTAVTVFAIYLGLGLLDWLFKKLFVINERVKERFPGLEERTNRHIRIIRTVFRWVLVIIGLGVIAHIWGIPIASIVASKVGSLVITRAIAIAITVGVIVLIIEISQFLRDYLLKAKKGKKKKKEPTQKMKTLVPMINAATKIAAGFIGGIIILAQLGVNTTPILAGAGIVGLAVGFGSQTLVKDLINGLFMLFEDSIRIGDYVKAGKDEGVVEAVGLRTVKLRDVSGNVHVIPNSSIDTVTNMSKEFSRSVIDIGVAYREDVDEVIGILKEIGEEMRNDPEHAKDILEPMEVFGLQSFDDSAIVIRVRLTTKPLKQWGLKRQFNRRVKKAFDERGIEIPFPHRTIYLGEPKKGDAPPLHVKLQQGSAANTKQQPAK